MHGFMFLLSKNISLYFPLSSSGHVSCILLKCNNQGPFEMLLANCDLLMCMTATKIIMKMK